MGESSNAALRFLSDFVTELPLLNGDGVTAGIAGSYAIELGDTLQQAIDACSYYLEQRNCPFLLRAFLAKKAASILCATLDETEPCPYATSEVLFMAALDSLNKLCHNLLEHPELIESSALEMALPYTSSEFAIKNKRRKMEDRHIVIHDLNLFFPIDGTPSCSYYAVFDGHAGIDAATFASAHLHANIVNHTLFLSDPAEAISQAFVFTDKEFCERAGKEGIKGGSTAVTALIMNRNLYTSWLGDSQAVLIKGGKPVTLMTPHTPDRKDERDRIESLGGFVCHIGTWRVNGTLAVSRAIGDYEFKPYVCSQPEITVTPLDGSEDFLILACDGLWDFATPEDVSVMIYTTLLNAPSDSLNNIAEKLVYRSKDLGSDDNITAIVVFLRNVQDIAKDAARYSFPALNSLDGDPKEKGEWKIFSEGVEKFDAEEQNHAPERPKSLHGDISTFPCLKHEHTDPPPEATFLSELPTPPIDDLMISKSADLTEQLSELTIKANKEINAYNANEYSTLELTPIDSKEALQIANNIVSNIIETAVTELGSNTYQKDKSMNEVEPIHSEVNTSSVVDVVEKQASNTCDTILDTSSAVDSNPLVELNSSEAVTIPEDFSSTGTLLVDCIAPTIIKPTTVDVDDFNSVAIEDYSKENSNLAEVVCTKDIIDLGSTNQKNEILLEDKTLSAGNLETARNDVCQEALQLMDESLVEGVSVEHGLAVLLPIVVPTVEIKADDTTTDQTLQAVSDVLVVSDTEIINQGNKSTEVVSDSKNSDDIPTAAVDLDLKSVPENIPEADCVAEDNDSESENNCGWSYVKTTNTAPVQEKAKDAKQAPEAKVPLKKNVTTMKPKSPHPSTSSAIGKTAMSSTLRSKTTEGKNVAKATADGKNVGRASVEKKHVAKGIVEGKTTVKSATSRIAHSHTLPSTRVQKVTAVQVNSSDKVASARSRDAKTATTTDVTSKRLLPKAKEAVAPKASVNPPSKRLAGTLPSTKQNGLLSKRPLTPSSGIKNTLPKATSLSATKTSSATATNTNKEAAKLAPTTSTIMRSKPPTTSTITKAKIAASATNKPASQPKPLPNQLKPIPVNKKVLTTNTTKSTGTLSSRVTSKTKPLNPLPPSKAKNPQITNKAKKETPAVDSNAANTADQANIQNSATSTSNP